MKKRVIVIGGGIAGLSAGVYAQQCGFEVAILESHSIAGGNCTSWKRKGYLFEGGMHWLTGSDKKQPINKLWRNIGALNDSVKIHRSEPYMEYFHNGEPIRLYRKVDLTEKHLLSLSPADAEEIEAFCDHIRKVQKLAMPVFDIPGVKVTKKQSPSLSLLAAGVSALRLMSSFSKITRDSYVNRFSHEGIRSLLHAVTEEKTGVLPLFFSMGVISSGDGGFPEGGSLPFVGRIVERFKSLGGTLLLSTRAERVVVKRGHAVGVVVGGRLMPADAVIIASDTMTADGLFKFPLKSAWLAKMQATTEPTMVTFISLGIDADLRRYNKGLVFKLQRPIKLASQTYEYLNVNNYAGDPAYSAEGKTAMTIMLGGDTYDYWKRAREAGNYDTEKRRLADEIIAALTEHIPVIKGRVEVCDVATPLTYERYCGNWKGSWMTEMTSEMKMKSYPAVIKGLNGVYFAGQRMMPPGGLPVALMSGRTAVQYLCRDTGTVFISEE
jgi:phytoene dehydrogenase-like protein